MQGDVAEESKRPRLVAPCWMGTGAFEELVGEGARVLAAVNEPQLLTQLSQYEALITPPMAPGGHVLSGLREQGEGLCGAPTEHIGHTQG